MTKNLRKLSYSLLKPSKRKWLTPTVLALGFVSFFMDIASEMLYPVMPIYLEEIGFSIILIGVLEGFAEGISGWSKGFFGQLSDNRPSKLPFVRLGYLLSALSKPLLAVFTFPIWVFAIRFLDRIGKGVRTGARDALLSAEATPQDKGKVFGFHRSMDTAGAFLGPILALIFLFYYPGEYKWLFFLAFIPGILSIGATFIIKDKSVFTQTKTSTKVGFFSFLKFVKNSPKEYKRLLTALLLFALFNSSDIFLLLLLKHAGIPDPQIIGFYIFYNLIYAIFSYPLGSLGDKIGLKTIQIAGFIVFVLVYLGMAFAESFWHFGVLFFLYGIYAAATEGISKAWLTLTVKKEETATAIGSMEALKSILTFISSSLAGIIWTAFSSKDVFITSAVGVAFVIVYMAIFAPKPQTSEIH